MFDLRRLLSRLVVRVGIMQLYMDKYISNGRICSGILAVISAIEASAFAMHKKSQSTNFLSSKNAKHV